MARDEEPEPVFEEGVKTEKLPEPKEIDEFAPPERDEGIPVPEKPKPKDIFEATAQIKESIEEDSPVYGKPPLNKQKLDKAIKRSSGKKKK